LLLDVLLCSKYLDTSDAQPPEVVYNRAGATKPPTQRSRATYAVTDLKQEHQQQELRAENYRSPYSLYQLPTGVRSSSVLPREMTGMVLPSIPTPWGPNITSNTNWSNATDIFNALREALKSKAHYQTLLDCFRWRGQRYNLYTGNEEQVPSSHVNLDEKVLMFFTKANQRIGLPDLGWELWQSINDERSAVKQQRSRKICIEALKWVCLTFPRTQSARLPHKSMQELFTPMLRCLLGIVQPTNVPSSLQDDVVEVILESIKFDWSLLEIAPSYLQPNTRPELGARLALEKSIVFRLRKQYDESDNVIHDALSCSNLEHGQGCFPNLFGKDSAGRRGAWNAVVGLLHRSHLENLIQRGCYLFAIQQAYNWTTPTSPTSDIEAHALSQRALTLSEVHRALGEFNRARDYLEMVCLSPNGEKDAHYPELFCRLLDVYNDLGLRKEGETLLKRLPKGSVGPDDTPTRDNTPTRRHFVASRMDHQLLSRKYCSAEAEANKLASMLEKLSFFTADEELLWIRALVAIAQIHQLSNDPANAVRPWLDVLQCLKSFNNEQSAGYFEVVFFSLYYVSLRKGDKQRATNYLAAGVQVQKSRRRRRGIARRREWLGEIYKSLVEGKANLRRRYWNKVSRVL
jgi:hypothetical protein